MFFYDITDKGLSWLDTVVPDKIAAKKKLRSAQLRENKISRKKGKDCNPRRYDNRGKE